MTTNISEQGAQVADDNLEFGMRVHEKCDFGLPFEFNIYNDIC